MAEIGENVKNRVLVTFQAKFLIQWSVRLKMSHFAGNRQLLRPLETPDRLKTIQMCVSTERPALGECFEKEKNIGKGHKKG